MAQKKNPYNNNNSSLKNSDRYWQTVSKKKKKRGNILRKPKRLPNAKPVYMYPNDPYIPGSIIILIWVSYFSIGVFFF